MGLSLSIYIHLDPGKQSKPVWPHLSWLYGICSKSTVALSTRPTSDAGAWSGLANQGPLSHPGT